MKLSATTFADHHQATGIVTLAEKFLTTEERAALATDAPRPRELNEAGHPLVDVECLRVVDRWGRRATEVYAVRVPEAPAVLAVQPGPVQFTGLAVDVYVSSGQLRSKWTADGIAGRGRSDS